MKQKVYKLWVLAFLLFIPFIGKAVTVTDSAAAANVQVCLKPEIVRLQFSVGGTGTTGSYLDIKLPTGFTWEGIAYGPIVTGGSGSNTMTYAGVVGGKHRITFGSSTALQTIKLGFWQKATCAAGTSSFTTRDSLFFYEGSGSINTSATNAFNGSTPAFSVTGVTNTPSPANVGNTITRIYTITNGGNGGIANFMISDKFLSGALTPNNTSFRINPSGVNYTIPTARITIATDSIRVLLNATDVQQIGDGDSIFEFGESFEIRYQALVNNCGVSNNINSVLAASWGCNGSYCARGTGNTGISVVGVGTPSFAFSILNIERRRCVDGSIIDSLRLINNGSGSATQLKIQLNAGTGGTGLAVYDTSTLRYKIGLNGLFIKPNNIIPAVTNWSLVEDTLNMGSCNSGFYKKSIKNLEFIVPFLKNGDTLFINILNKSCISNACNPTFKPNGRVNSSGTRAFQVIQYKNDCGNVVYSDPFNIINTGVWSLGTQGSYYVPAELRDGTTDSAGVFTQNVLSQNFTGNTSNGIFEIRLNLPAGVELDNSVSNPLYYINNGTTKVLPYQKNLSTNIFKFRPQQLHSSATLSQFVIKLKGNCGAPGASGGRLSLGFNVFMTHDSSYCPTLHQVRCTDMPILLICPNPCLSGGAVFDSLQVFRTTYGLPDNNNDGIPESGSVNLNLINTKDIAPTDSFEIRQWLHLVTNGTHPSWEFLYSNFDAAPVISARHSHVRTTVYLNRASGNDTVFTLTPTISGGNYAFNYSNLPNYQNNDSIYVVSKFVALDNQAYALPISHYFLGSAYASHISNPTLPDQYGCNVRGELMKTHWRVGSGGGAGLYALTGCNQLNQAIVTRYEAFNQQAVNTFKNEYRPRYHFRTHKVVIPSGIEFDSIQLDLAYFNGGINNAGRVFYNSQLMPYYSFSGDTFIVNLQNMFTISVPAIGQYSMPDESMSFNIRAYMRANCKALALTDIRSPFRRDDYMMMTLPPQLFTDQRTNDFYTRFFVTNPQLLAYSATPTKDVYSNVFSWDLTLQNAVAVNAPYTWVSFQSLDGKIVVDSVKDGATIITPNGNGYFQLGATNNSSKNLIIYAKHSACSPDSILVHYGYSCNGYPTSPISSSTQCYAPYKLYMNPQTAAIQTSIKALNLTPVDPSNAGSSAYGSTTIYMCQGFPFEMEISSTVAGNIYNVKETLTLPFNGGVGLDYISDSGYIEYPIGTAPRLFSSAANTAILAQVPTGTMTLDLEQIDPTNFGPTSGLLGTGLGTNATRRAILRWKMKSNCDLVSGDQWTARQEANSPCGNAAAGDSTVTSGFPLNLAGVTNPYVATVKVSTGLDGCGAQTTQIRLEKTGATAPQPTDSITIRLPLLVAAGTMTCSGTACPGGTGSTQSYTVRTDALYQYLTFQYPNTAGANGDTLLYSFPMTSRNKATCENNQTVKADVFQQLTVYCGAPIPANLCPNAKASLGSETKSFDIRKANLSFDAYSSTYVYPSLYKYVFGGNVLNTSNFVAAGTGVTLKTFMDVNNNLTYEKGIDALVKTTVLGSAIPTNGSVSFNDSFENNLYPPSPSLPMYTVIDTGDATANCFCGGVVQSAFNQALLIEFLELNASNISNVTGKIQWLTNADNHTVRFDIYRRTENETNYSKIGYVMAQKGNINQSNYIYYDPISALSDGRIYYQIEAVSQHQINKMSKVVSISKTVSIINNNVFVMSPNPSNQFVKINLGEGLINGEITITDINGKMVYQGSFKGVETIIKTNELAQGVYTVSIKTSDLIEVQKLSVIK